MDCILFNCCYHWYINSITEAIQMRTQVSNVGQAKNGKWWVSFDTFCGKPGQEYLANSIQSAPVFGDEDQAWRGGIDALNTLEVTGKYPNLCEVW